MSCYLPDLLTLESTGLIDEGTVVVAGNVVFPGAPDFLKYLRDPRNGYAASMVAARFQFDEKWDPSSTSRPDALAVAVRGRPTHDNATDSLRPTATLNSPPAFALGGKQSLYDSFPSTRLRGAVAKLQDVCREIPNGKRCAPIPVHYTRSA